MSANAPPWEKCMMGCAVSPDAKITLLPCFHVLCSEQCVVNIKMEMKVTGNEGKQHCKKCSREFSFDQLKTQVKLKTFLPRKVDSSDVVLKCGSCDVNDPVVSYCPTCEVNLCKACTEHHPRFLKNLGHKLESNLEGRRALELERFKVKQGQCQFHYGKHAAYFCFTCQLKMCGDCKRAHDISHPVVVVTDEMAATQARIASARKTQAMIKLNISKLRLKLQSLEEEECKKFINDVQEFMSRALHLLKQYCKALFEEGCKKHTMIYDEIVKKIARLEHAKEDASHCLRILDQLDRLDDVGMINVARSSFPLTNNLNQVKQELRESKFREFVKKGPRVALVGGKLSDSQIILPRAEFVKFDDIYNDDSQPDSQKTLPDPNLIEHDAEVQSEETFSRESNEPAATSMTPSRTPRTRMVAVMRTGGLRVPRSSPETQAYTRKSAITAAMQTTPPDNQIQSDSARDHPVINETRTVTSSDITPIPRRSKRLQSTQSAILPVPAKKTRKT